MLGPVSFELVRRGGRWRLARVPDLQLPPEFAPHALEWRVTNSYASNDGETFTIVGRIDNTGDETVLQLGTPGFIRDEAGRTLRTELSALTARPFVHPGEHTHFRLDFQLSPGSTPDLERSPEIALCSCRSSASRTPTTRASWRAASALRRGV